MKNGRDGSIMIRGGCNLSLFLIAEAWDSSGVANLGQAEYCVGVNMV